MSQELIWQPKIWYYPRKGSNLKPLNTKPSSGKILPLLPDCSICTAQEDCPKIKWFKYNTGQLEKYEYKGSGNCDDMRNYKGTQIYKIDNFQGDPCGGESDSCKLVTEGGGRKSKRNRRTKAKSRRRRRHE